MSKYPPKVIHEIKGCVINFGLRDMKNVRTIVLPNVTHISDISLLPFGDYTFYVDGISMSWKDIEDAKSAREELAQAVKQYWESIYYAQSN